MAEKISQINVGNTVYDIVDQEHRNLGGSDAYRATNLSNGPESSVGTIEQPNMPLSSFDMALSSDYTLVYYTLVHGHKELGRQGDDDDIPGIYGYQFNLVVKPKTAKTINTSHIFLTMNTKYNDSNGLAGPRNNFSFSTAANSPLVICETTYLNNSTRTNAAASFATYPYGLTLTYKEAVAANTELKFYTQGISPTFYK